MHGIHLIKSPQKTFRKDLAPLKTNKQILLFVTVKALSCQSQLGVKRKRFCPPRKSCQCRSSLPLLMPSNSQKNNNQVTIGYVTPKLIGNALELCKMDARDLNSESELQAATLFLLSPCIFVPLLPDGTAHTEVSDRPHPDLRGKIFHQCLI